MKKQQSASVPLESPMRMIKRTLLAALLGLALVAGQAAADDYQTESADVMAQSDELFTVEELDDLLAPIALYPDPLLAQILPAATFIDQIDEAARYVRQYGQARIDDQPWDVSVKAVAHYPDVLAMMDQKYDWSVSLGQAYVNQPQDVLESIQHLRAEARERGNLVSSSEQAVLIEDDSIRIVPSEPEVIYVPSYDPLLVYAYPPPTYGFITFSVGFTIGAWLNRDCDWQQHRIYYHGWQGSGWIDRSRHYVNTQRSIYIRNTYSTINVNRRVVLHDTGRYREDIRRNVEYRRENRVTPAIPRRDRQPRSGMESRGTVAAPSVSKPRSTPAPATSAPVTIPPRVTIGRPSAPRPESNGFFRGRDPHGTQPAANSGYGGYGSGKDAKTFRERGQSSRENIRPFNRQQTVPANSARPGASGRQQSAPGQTTPRKASPGRRSGGEQKQR
jgi:hypothetical protein